MPAIAYPVIDLFAGPGGLGEGFAALQDEPGANRFRTVASIEQDEFSHRTLLLRHLFRAFSSVEVPDDYYRYLNNDIDFEELSRCHQKAFAEANGSAIRVFLGPENHEIVKRAITERLAGEKRWALVGGPPCQAYSLAGRSRMMGNPQFQEDERHFLYREYLKIIIDHRPPVFVMENVKGLLSAKIDGDPIIEKIVSDLSQPNAAMEGGANELSYRLYSLSNAEPASQGVDPRLFIVKAEEHGIPQARHRMFIVGVRSDFNARPKQLCYQPSPTVKQTIGDLPAIRSGLSRGKDSTRSWREAIAGLSQISLESKLDGAPFAEKVLDRIRLQTADSDRPESRFSLRYPDNATYTHKALRGLRDDRLTVLTGHDSRGHMASDLQRYLYAATFAEVTGKSPKLADFPVALLPNHANVQLGRSGQMFSDRFRVQLPDQVSTTITSHISKDGHYYIHHDPMQCRSLTVREAARLQTFPDNYKFEGPRTAQYHQVGNAVPPYLASQIAEIISEVLDSIGSQD